MNRRGFSGLIGSLFGGGVAAKAGVITPAIVPPAAGSGGVAMGMGAAAKMASKFASDYKKLEKVDMHVKALRLLGIIPQYVLEDLWEATKDEYTTGEHIDPNVACLKSVSKSAKALMVRERAFKRAKENWWSEPEKRLKRAVWQKANPFTNTYHPGIRGGNAYHRYDEEDE